MISRCPRNPIETNKLRMPIRDHIERIVRPLIEAHNALLIDIAVRGDRGTKIVEVFIDNDTGVTTAMCAEISRELSRAMDVEDISWKRCSLVVSSPGTERPLRFPRQYPKHVGRTLVVKLAGPAGGEIRGELIEATPEAIRVRIPAGGDMRTIPFGELLEARVATPFEH